MMTNPLLGLIGILIAAMTAELNDVVTSIALVDVRGAFGISYDPGTWIQSLYEIPVTGGLLVPLHDRVAVGRQDVRVVQELRGLLIAGPEQHDVAQGLP